MFLNPLSYYLEKYHYLVQLLKKVIGITNIKKYRKIMIFTLFGSVPLVSFFFSAAILMVLHIATFIISFSIEEIER